MSQRTIYLSAALFNWLVGLGLLFALAQLAPLLQLGPVPAVARMFVDLFAVLVCGFGVAYYLLAIDFERYRVLAGLGAVAKLAVVVVVLCYYLAGHIAWPLLALSGGDLVYALIFINTLRRPSAAPDKAAQSGVE